MRERGLIFYFLLYRLLSLTWECITFLFNRLSRGVSRKGSSGHCPLLDGSPQPMFSYLPCHRE